MTQKLNIKHYNGLHLMYAISLVDYRRAAQDMVSCSQSMIWVFQLGILVCNTLEFFLRQCDFLPHQYVMSALFRIKHVEGWIHHDNPPPQSVDYK